jgi:hypothetical protein
MLSSVKVNSLRAGALPSIWRMGGDTREPGQAPRVSRAWSARPGRRGRAGGLQAPEQPRRPGRRAKDAGIDHRPAQPAAELPQTPDPDDGRVAGGAPGEKPLGCRGRGSGVEVHLEYVRRCALTGAGGTRSAVGQVQGSTQDTQAGQPDRTLPHRSLTSAFGRWFPTYPPRWYLI